MSGLVIDKYNNLPTNLLLLSGEVMRVPLCKASFKCCGKEEETASCNKSNMYFLWFKCTPSFVLHNSIPRKYFAKPKSLIVNFLSKVCLNDTISRGQLSVTNISSTYTNAGVKSQTKNNHALIVYILRKPETWSIQDSTVLKLVSNHTMTCLIFKLDQLQL